MTGWYLAWHSSWLRRARPAVFCLPTPPLASPAQNLAKALHTLQEQLSYVNSLVGNQQEPPAVADLALRQVGICP